MKFLIHVLYKKIRWFRTSLFVFDVKDKCLGSAWCCHAILAKLQRSVAAWNASITLWSPVVIRFWAATHILGALKITWDRVVSNVLRVLYIYGMIHGGKSHDLSKHLWNINICISTYPAHVVAQCRHRCLCAQSTNDSRHLLCMNPCECCYALDIFSWIEFAGQRASYGIPVLIIVEHYGDVIMRAIASHITSVSMVCSTVCSGADQRKHQSSTSLAFVRGIPRWPVNSPYKRPVTREIFPFDDVIMDNWLCFNEIA